MLKVLSVTNFMAIEKLELEFTAPLTILAGQNEAGKSSVRDAILWLWTGQARGLKTHGDQAALIREGAKFTEVSALLADGRGFTRRKTQKTAATVMGDIPDLGLSPAVLFDPYNFLLWPDGDRRELLFKIIPGLSPNEQNVFDRLACWPAVTAIAEGTTDEDADGRVVPIVKAIARMAASHGFPGAEKECVTKRREAKRVRDEYKGVTEPEKTLTIDGQSFDIPTLNLPAIEAMLKELQREKDDLLRQKGAEEARAKRLATIRGQLEKIGAMDTPAGGEDDRLQKIIDTNQTAYEEACQEILKTKTSQEVFPRTCPAITIQQIPCPKAGEKIGQEPPETGMLETLMQNRDGLLRVVSDARIQLGEYQREVDAYQIAMAKKESLETELKDLNGTPEAGADLDAEIATRQRRIERGVAFQRAVTDYKIFLATYQREVEKLAAAEQEVIIYDALQKALAPDGIPSQMIAEALDGINELLEDAARYFFPGRYLHLTGDLGIVLQNSPYITLSKSAKYRVGVAFQFALAKLTGARILLIDEVDILDDDRQDDLIKFLLAKITDFDQIMVFMTCTKPPDFVDDTGKIQFWWIENGTIKS